MTERKERGKEDGQKGNENSEGTNESSIHSQGFSLLEDHHKTCTQEEAMRKRHRNGRHRMPDRSVLVSCGIISVLDVAESNVGKKRKH